MSGEAEDTTHHEEVMIFLVQKILDHSSLAQQSYDRVMEAGGVDAVTDSVMRVLELEQSMANMYSQAMQAVSP